MAREHFDGLFANNALDEIGVEPVLGVPVSSGEALCQSLPSWRSLDLRRPPKPRSAPRTRDGTRPRPEPEVTGAFPARAGDLRARP